MSINIMRLKQDDIEHNAYDKMKHYTGRIL